MCIHLPQRNANSSTPRTTAPGSGVRHGYRGRVFVLTNIPLLYSGPRLPFGDALTGLSQSLDELFRGDRDEKHGLFRDHRELLSISLATFSCSSVRCFTVSAFRIFCTLDTGNGFFPDSLDPSFPSSLVVIQTVAVSVDGDRRVFSKARPPSIWSVTTAKYMAPTTYNLATCGYRGYAA